VDKKKIIRKILFLSLWLLILGGMTTLLIAANSRKKEHVCSEVLIGIKGSGEKFYIEKEDIFELIRKTAGSSLVNKPITGIDPGKLEKALEKNSWIRDAELYFDSKDALHVSVTEREPIARIFATNGSSFYIDSSAHKMNLVEKLSARVPVITGFVDIKKMNAKDSAFLEEVKEVAQFIYSNEFWNAQTGQIDITSEKTFELIPVIGDHIIKLGRGEKVEEKLNRLFVFYRQVLGKVGFNKYAALDVQYDGQVVAIRKEPTSPVDSIQLQKNIEALINKAMMQEIDETMLPGQMNIVNPDSAKMIAPVKTDSVPPKTNPNPVQRSPNPVKTTARPNPVKPKAVMKRQ
jgi:cell division protein FtsQ